MNISTFSDKNVTIKKILVEDIFAFFIYRTRSVQHVYNIYYNKSLESIDLLNMKRWIYIYSCMNKLTFASYFICFYCNTYILKIITKRT